MSLLGVCAILFYCAMAGAGFLPGDLLPQFLVSGMVFLLAGPLLKAFGRNATDDGDDNEEPDAPLTERDWSYFTILLNWSMVLLIIACLAVWVMKPLGMSFGEFLLGPVDHDRVFSQILAP
ncbi:MAG: hypothetical protein Kow00100_15660 [Geothermobacteraceae bacterium]